MKKIPALCLAALALGACVTDISVDEERTRARGAAVDELTDDQIAAVVAAIHEGEVRHARLARERGIRDDVRSYAQMLIDMHSAAANDLKRVRQRAGLGTRESPLYDQLVAESKSLGERLRAQPARDFDRAYLDAEVTAHQRALEITDEELLPEVESDELKGYLQRTRSTFASHMEQARELSRGRPVAAR